MKLTKKILLGSIFFNFLFIFSFFFLDTGKLLNFINLSSNNGTSKEINERYILGKLDLNEFDEDQDQEEIQISKKKQEIQSETEEKIINDIDYIIENHHIKDKSMYSNYVTGFKLETGIYDFRARSQLNSFVYLCNSIRSNKDILSTKLNELDINIEKDQGNCWKEIIYSILDGSIGDPKKTERLSTTCDIPEGDLNDKHYLSIVVMKAYFNQIFTKEEAISIFNDLINRINNNKYESDYYDISDKLYYSLFLDYLESDNIEKCGNYINKYRKTLIENFMNLFKDYLKDLEADYYMN